MLFGKHRTTKMLQIFYFSRTLKWIVLLKQNTLLQTIQCILCSAGYDLFAAEDKTLFPDCITPVTIEIEMENRWNRNGNS